MEDIGNRDAEAKRIPLLETTKCESIIGSIALGKNRF